MSRMLTALAAGTTLVLATTGLATTAPAHADTQTFSDRHGEVRPAFDITSYQVVNGRRIGVRTKHADLTRQARGIQFWVDLPGTRHHWDFRVSATFDHSFARVDLPDGTSDTTGPCRDIRVRRSLAHDSAVLSVPRECIGAFDEIRLRVRVRYGPTGRRQDTAPGRFRYSDWVSAVRD